MLELFRTEVETQTSALTAGLLEIERGPAPAQLLETLMRAAHSLKGAARILNVPAAVRVAHAMEDCFVAAQRGALHLRQAEIDLLLRGVDLLAHLGKRTEAGIGYWENDQAGEIGSFLDSVERLQAGARGGALPVEAPPGRARGPVGRNLPVPSGLGSWPPALGASGAEPLTKAGASRHETAERIVRLNADNLNRLLGLAGE
jgi:two-component system, chemotaxis family, sensor histidine kinase and response regulator WspE